MEEWILTLLGEQQALLAAVRALITSHPDPASARSAWQQQRENALRTAADEMPGGSIRADAMRALLQELDKDFPMPPH